MAFRFRILIFAFGLLYILLGFNLYRIQIEKGDYYFKKAEARSEFKKGLELRRGQIFFTDKNNNTTRVAFNRDYPFIFASPKEIENPSLAAELLGPIIGWGEDELKAALQNSESLFRLLVDKPDGETIKAVSELNLKGIYIDEKKYRFYPFGALASQLLGFLGINESYEVPVGLYGIEKYHNKKLSAENDIKLTIDINIQTEAEQTLKDLIENFNASGGTVIVQEPKTGKILVMASSPGFDPNFYSKYPIKNFINPAVSNIYEPGSVFKPITMAAGIDLGVIAPETTYVDQGSVFLNGRKIENWDKKAYGKITMTNVIERSINTGAVFAESKIGHKNFYEYLKKFGFGDKSGIDLPEEAAGDLRSLEGEDIRDIDFATASFGQGPAVTPIQLVNAYSAIASGGVLMRPYVDASLEPKVIRRVISEETAKKVTLMMESAVQKAGVAAISGFRIAGKTGTAQIPDFNKGGYTEELIHNFVGFAPASNPKFVVLIKIDKPDKPLAGLTVVPAFRKLTEYIINYYHIAPDRLE